jgi:DNA modification methylase
MQKHRSGKTYTSLAQIEYRKIDSLAPNPRNARTHSPRQIRQIARSIKQFGFVNPILIDSNCRIICGHGRVASARLLELNEVPTITVEHLSEAQLRAYVVADNRLAEKAGWDKETLALELQGLIDLEFDVELTGFEIPEIDILLEETQAERDEIDDPIPPLRRNAVICRSGDLWLLNKHRLVCGDARNPEAYRLLMADEKAQFIFTDPPYNVPIRNHVSGLGRARHREFKMASGEMSSQQFAGFLSQVFQQLAYNSIVGSIHQICMDWRHLAEMLDAGTQVYSELKNLCIWNKSNAGMGSFYRSKHELIFVWKYGKAAHINNVELGQFGRARSNVWDYASVNSFGSHRMNDLAMHPTVKPVAMVADAIKDCSQRGAIVLDSFAGSGTLCIACENTGRNARVMEIDPAYCDVIIRRWQARTGKRVVHGTSHISFEELEDKLQLEEKKDAERPSAKTRG